MAPSPSCVQSKGTQQDPSSESAPVQVSSERRLQVHKSENLRTPGKRRGQGKKRPCPKRMTRDPPHEAPDGGAREGPVSCACTRALVRGQARVPTTPRPLRRLRHVTVS